LLENVNMKKEYLRIISEYIGTKLPTCPDCGSSECLEYIF